MKRITFLITLFFTITICYAQSSDNEKYEQATKHYKAKEYNKAITILNELAARNHAKGLDLLGSCYNYGYGVSKNKQKATELYLKSANLGWKGGQLHLAYSYLEDEDFTHAATWFKKAAKAGSYVALYELGLMYEYGENFDQDIDSAHHYYLKAAENGYYLAQIKLAWLYQDEDYQIAHENIIEDKLNSMTEKWLREAAKQNSDGMFELACYYDIRTNLYGDIRYPVPIDTYRKAAEAGSGKGLAVLGSLSLSKKDYENAIVMYQQATQKGVKKTRCFPMDITDYSIATLVIVAQFLKQHQDFELLINHGRGIMNGSFCCWEDGDNIYIYVKKRNQKNGYIKLSKKGNMISSTPFSFDYEEGEYNADLKAFRIGYDTFVDIKGNKIEVQQ